jgi:hypothetical protein
LKVVENGNSFKILFLMDKQEVGRHSHRPGERRLQMNFIENFVMSEAEIRQLELAKRIKVRNRIAKIMDALAGYDVSGITITANNHTIRAGTTEDGRKFRWEANHGMAERSLYCGTLYIDGELVFTSGTIERAIPYLAAPKTEAKGK